MTHSKWLPFNLCVQSFVSRCFLFQGPILYHVHRYERNCKAVEVVKVELFNPKVYPTVPFHSIQLSWGSGVLIKARLSEGRGENG